MQQPRWRRFAKQRGGAKLRMEEAMSGHLRGVVRTKSGAALPEASIVVVESPGPVPDIAPISDEEGQFELDEIPEGMYLIRALGPGGERGEARVSVEAGSMARTEIVVG